MNRIEITISKFEAVTAEVKSLFANLSLVQLNWKPSAEKWSIAQCLDHLMVTNQTFYPQLQEVISGNHKNSFYQNIKFISRYFGSYLIRETGSVVNKPQKNPPTWTPSQSDLPATIVSDFLKHQQEFSSLVSQLDKTDLENTVISSPALFIIIYSLNDALIILAGHEQRHLQQARNILSHPDFPQ